MNEAGQGIACALLKERMSLRGSARVPEVSPRRIFALL